MNRRSTKVDYWKPVRGLDLDEITLEHAHRRKAVRWGAALRDLPALLALVGLGILTGAIVSFVDSGRLDFGLLRKEFTHIECEVRGRHDWLTGRDPASRAWLERFPYDTLRAVREKQQRSVEVFVHTRLVDRDLNNVRLAIEIPQNTRVTHGYAFRMTRSDQQEVFEGLEIELAMAYEDARNATRVRVPELRVSDSVLLILLVQSERESDLDLIFNAIQESGGRLRVLTGSAR